MLSKSVTLTFSAFRDTKAVHDPKSRTPSGSSLQNYLTPITNRHKDTFPRDIVSQLSLKWLLGPP